MSDSAPLASGPAVAFHDAVRVWVRVACLSFGGPAGQIAVMHKILVEEKKWISESRFLHALNYCMLLPGPEAQQLATYIGWLLHGVRGGLVAGLLFILPGILALMGLSLAYTAWHDTLWLSAIFFGLKPAVIAIVLEAVVRIGKRALKNSVMAGIAVVAFVALFAFNVPFPCVILTAALVGWFGQKINPALFAANPRTAAAEKANESDYVINDQSIRTVQPTFGRAVKILLIFGVLWFGPLAVILALLGRSSIYWQLGTFFSQAAVVTFGGAYAVLAYVQQAAVNTYHWLSPLEMVDGLGMAETTPGPLIMVLQFVGYLAAYRTGASGMQPWQAGVLGGLLTTWVTFTPCFLWVFLGAPYVERLRSHKALGAAMACITAAVVGVILNLSVWFAVHTLFAKVEMEKWGVMSLPVPEGSSLSVGSIGIAIGAVVLVFVARAPMWVTLGLGVMVGVGVKVLVG